MLSERVEKMPAILCEMIFVVLHIIPTSPWEITVGLHIIVRIKKFDKFARNNKMLPIQNFDARPSCSGIKEKNNIVFFLSFFLELDFYPLIPNFQQSSIVGYLDEIKIAQNIIFWMPQCRYLGTMFLPLLCYFLCHFFWVQDSWQ